MDSILAICVLNENWSWFINQAYLCIPSTTAVAAASARVNYTRHRTQAEPTNKLPLETTTAAVHVLPHKQP